ncbi:MOSC N-terminal beta barrel [Penicillium canariense]|uniref:MOSC N-terminal beta barrel n=1 Tax=Penicillium canariense TaxID=189055 RepID=A0A9W9IB01_9EURO|nr:MOSC N-terminal beta barrel [Penicillium canariense]KAJ5169207.1 MOSC N-terminal beta barrel [Penicillium canariense]
MSWAIGSLEISASGALIISGLLWIVLIGVFPLLVLINASPSPGPKGCRRLGLPQGQSNLTDEYDQKYSEGVPSDTKDENGQPAWRVKALFTYPLKSCGGIELQKSDVVPTGLKFDRQFAFAEETANGWNCRTLRNAGFQRMALIHPEIWVPDPSSPDYDERRPEMQSGGVMVISYPRLAPLGLWGTMIKIGMTFRILATRRKFSVPLVPSQDSKYPVVPVSIWKDTPRAYDYGSLLPASLHEYLGFKPSESPLTLFRAHPSHSREIFRNAPRKEQIGFQPSTAFADAYPIHLLNLASHRDVAARCAAAIPRLSIRRFRANIIVQGPEAFAEDHWKRFTIGGTEIHAACRTVRCRLPNVDPDTGDRHKAEPDRTLKSYRRIDDGDRTNACLGMQLVPSVEEFSVSVGDEVRVLETGEHLYMKMLAPGEKVEGV